MLCFYFDWNHSNKNKSKYSGILFHSISVFLRFQKVRQLLTRCWYGLTIVVPLHHVFTARRLHCRSICHASTPYQHSSLWNFVHAALTTVILSILMCQPWENQSCRASFRNCLPKNIILFIITSVGMFLFVRFIGIV